MPIKGNWYLISYFWIYHIEALNTGYTYLSCGIYQKAPTKSDLAFRPLNMLHKTISIVDWQNFGSLIDENLDRDYQGWVSRPSKSTKTNQTGENNNSNYFSWFWLFCDNRGICFGDTFSSSLCDHRRKTKINKFLSSRKNVIWDNDRSFQVRSSLSTDKKDSI